MAIERGLGSGGDAPVTAQEQAEIDIVELPAQPGIAEMEDGSAIVGELMQEEAMAAQDIPFDANLAEYIEIQT